jgi:hypothetical protein
MRITNPVAFNYKEMIENLPPRMAENTEILHQRLNVVVKNEMVTMWGRDIDPENGIMELMSISVSRDYTKESKQQILDLWESFLEQFASENPEEIIAKREERLKKEEEKRKKAEEAVQKAEAKKKEAEAKLKATKEAKKETKKEKKTNAS